MFRIICNTDNNKWKRHKGGMPAAHRDASAASSLAEPLASL